MNKLSIIAVLVCLLGFGEQAKAAFQIKITVGSNATDTFTDNQFGVDADPETGGMSIVQILHGYKFTITANTDSPGSNAAGGTVTQATLAIRRIGGADNTVSIEISSDGFTFGGGAYPIMLSNAISSTLLMGSDPTASATSSLDSDTTDAAVLQGVISGPSPVGDGTTLLVMSPASTFTLSNTLTISGLPQNNGPPSGQDNVSDATINVTTTANIVPVPPALVWRAQQQPSLRAPFARSRLW